jgi:hypothetical protein
MRRLASFIFLILLAAGVWFGARWFAHRGEIKATIVFDRAGSLRRGDPVLEDGLEVGRVIRVDKMDDRDAVTIRLSRQHRRAIVSDSLFSVDEHALNVSNTFAVGGPVEDGAILHARQDGVSRWLAKHGGAVKPFLDKMRIKADELIDRDFAQWTADAPTWKREGSESLRSHVDEVRRRVAKAESDLRAADKADEARKLKERFEKWLSDVTR